MVTTDEVLQILRQVMDPEIGINIVDLGLVYEAAVDGSNVLISMTMTTPACPLSKHLTDQVEMCLRRSLPTLNAVSIKLVWEPEWNPMMM